VWRYVLNDHASGTYRGIMTNVDTRQNDAVRADPGVVFNDDGGGRRHHVTLHEVVLVVVKDECVVTEKAMAPDTHKLVCRN
jgi:hypothetical protein